MPTHEGYSENSELFAMPGAFPIGKMTQVTITTPEDGDDCDLLTSFDLGAEYFAFLGPIHDKKLSRKKFKKFLMSEGIPRNTAECCCKVVNLKRVSYYEARLQYIIGGYDWFISWIMSYS